MKQTLAGFAAGAVVAAGVALVMRSGPAAPPVPVAPSTVAAAPPIEPAATPAPALVPVADPAPTPRAEPKPRASSPAPVRKPDPPVQISRADPPASVPAPSPAPAPVVQEPPVTPLPAPTPAPVLVPPPGTKTEPPAPPVRKPNTVTIPAGTLLNVRVMERISSNTHASGDTFAATLSEPLVVDGLVIADRSARAEGRVIQSDKGGRVKGTAFLTIELTRLTTADGQKLELRTEPFERRAQSSTKEDAAKVGAGAAIGAAIGAIAGGGRGAGIGAGAGAGAGAGGVLLGRGKAAELSVETRVSFRLTAPLTVTEQLK